MDPNTNSLSELTKSRDDARADVKKLLKARKLLPKDDFTGKSRISSEIKAAKKRANIADEALHKIAGDSKLASLPTVEECPSSFAHEFKISESTDDWPALPNSISSSIYHQPKWHNLFKNTMSRDVRTLVARDVSGSIIGCLPVALTHSKLFGRYGVSLPYVNYGGPAAVAENVGTALINHAFQQTDCWQIDYLEIRDTKYRPGLNPRTDKVCMILDLCGFRSFDEYKSSMPSKLRAQINKAQSADIEFRTGGLNLVNDFYSVFAVNMRDLGTPVYGPELFTSILELFPSSTTVVVGYASNQPVSAAFLIESKGSWEIPWASTLRRANKISANMALYAYVLEYVIDTGATSFDFGRSSIDAPTYKFKKQWGAKPRQLYWYYSDPTYSNALTISSPKYQLAISAWKRLPIPLTNLIGPRIVRNLP